MKKTYVVTTEFIAREHNEKYYAVGTHYESTDADRVAYLQELGFLEKPEPADPPEKKKKPE